MTPSQLLAASLPPSPAAGPRAGARFGNYELIDEIGRGAMGVVFTAMQRGSSRVVALKVAHGSLLGSAEARQRFRRETEAVGGLDHPGILPIYEVGEVEGVAYYTMRFAEAGSLAERRDWFANPREAAALIARLAAAVQHAHGRGVLHRDLKPGNILLASRTEPLIGDFGLARWLQRESDVTASLALLGTPDYLAPEMLRGAGEGSAIASDVFGLGAILYDLLAGAPPFAAGSVAEVLRKVDECNPAPIPGIPRDLAAVCSKCLEREPSARYASAGALAADLESWLAGVPVVARPVSLTGRLVRWTRRKPILAGLTIALVAATAGLVWNLVASRTKDRSMERQRGEMLDRLAGEQRRRTLFARAQTRMNSPTPGRKSESLRLLREAWQLGPSLEIRSAAVTALTLVDVEEVASPEVRLIEPATAPDVGLPVPSRVLQRAFHPATQRVALACADKTIYLGDTQAGTVFRRLRGHDGECHALAFSPDGHWLAAASDDQTLRLWDVRDGQEMLVISNTDAPQLRWSDDAAWLGFAPGRTLRLRPPAVARFFVNETPRECTEEVCTIDLSADGRWLVTVDEGGTRLWDARRERVEAVFAKEGTEWCAARFSPDSGKLWLGGWNSDLRRLLLPMDRLPVSVADLVGVLIEQSVDGQWVVALSNGGGGFQFVSTASPHRELWLPHPHPLCIALSRDGQRAATSSFDSAGVRLWDVPSAQMTRELPSPGAAKLASTPDGTILVAGEEQTVTLWEVGTGRSLRKVTARDRIKTLAFSPDGRFLAVETRTGLTLYRSGEPYDEIVSLKALPDRGTATFCFSRDSRELAVQTATGGAIVWQLDLLQRELAVLGMGWEQPLPASAGE